MEIAHQNEGSQINKHLLGVQGSSTSEKTLESLRFVKD